ncbi:uncharacterized protein ACA1_266210 [Acanthamoeba castellanii str. Neff]|uniref:Uncharacterized protein n=1 Tax=Acanthamoeba castellanii (strain ATCC 30010 / Neff) TaxID=1257118 RepID=L8H2C5_ACACF|nr:uncharacterized protein ACA1_266210 [Acanthamoeba castellanii str. Neff]ELR19395.1 hypothetical protein ACA1_266210 [Acanthamoeba castellanii str. Neff]
MTWRTRRFPGLHLPNRAALAREWAVARGTSTRLLVTTLRDPDFFANTPAQTAAASGAWVPWLSFVHSQPEAALGVMGDGMRAQVVGALDVVPGVRLSTNFGVIPASANDPRGSLLNKGIGLIPKTESELECYAIDGLQLSLTHATASLEGVDYVVNATVSVNPMALARRFAAASKLETPKRAFLERWQLEARITRIKPLNQPALGLPSLAVQYSHPLGPAPGDGRRVPRLVLTAKAQALNTLRLSVTYDPVDILAALDEGASQGKPAVTGVCASGVLSVSPSARAMQCLGTLRYYGDGYRATATAGWAVDPRQPSAAWTGTLSWVQRARNTSVGAFVSGGRFNDQLVTPRFGITLTHHI